jgi:WD40 repeat protein
MSVEEQLDDLLLQWEDSREQGRPRSAEELCRDCPELMTELRRRIDALRAIDSALATVTNPSTGINRRGPTQLASESKPAPPRTVAVPGYEILNELGRGGMGVVFKARQIGLGRIVALKMILAGAYAGREQRDRFRAEAEAAAQLQHPNIVQVYEIGEHEGCPYFSLEYVDGRTLQDVLADGLPPPRQAGELAEQLARAVAYAHGRGIVHRDLKPGNILLSFSREPPPSAPGALAGGSRPNEAALKITDFGLAKRLDDQHGRTRTGAVMGTPSYMSPEQAAGKTKEIGPSTDIYALGAILYEMLTGVPPFRGPSVWDTVQLVLTREPVSPSHHNLHVPRDLETICLKCLQKEPAKRYATSLALAEDLRRFQAGEPIEARPVGWLERGAKWVRRRPAVAALLAVTSMLLVALLVGGWVAVLQLYHGNRALVAAYKEHHAALIRLNVSNGIHYLREGDLYASLLWFARGLQLEDDDRRRETHRVRIAAVLRECPRLSGLWFHAADVTDVRFSPDGRWVLTASADHTARVWNVATGAARFETPLQHDQSILRASFSADGAHIVTASADGTARVWDSATGRRLAMLAGHQDVVRDACFSPDGGQIVTAADDKTARVWDAATGKPVGAPLPHKGPVVRASFHPSGNQVLTASADRSARVWSLGTETPALVARLSHDAPVTDACFDRAGKQVATASEDRTARVWNAATGQPLTVPLRHLGAVLRVAFSPDGQQLATASADLTGRIWDVQTGQAFVPALMHSAPVCCVAFSPDGLAVLTTSADNTARVWDSTNGRALTPPLPHNGSLSQACFSPDSRHIATAAADTTARVYDLVGPEVVPALGHDGPVWQASFSPDGQRVLTASADATARVWDAKTGQPEMQLRGHRGAVVRASFSADGGRIVTASADETAKIWGASSGQVLVTLSGHQGPLRTAAFSPDGRHVLTVGEDHTARIWDAATGAKGVVLRHETERRPDILDAVFHPDGRRVATAGHDGTARLWDSLTGRSIGEIMHHEDRVVQAAFSPDGRRLTTASVDRTARLWDAATGQPLLPISLQHAGPLRGVAFRPDSRGVLTASDDNTARAWDVETGQPILPPLRHDGTVVMARYSPDGQRIVTLSDDNTGCVWDAATGEPLTPALGHRGWGRLTDAAFNAAGDRLVTACEAGTAHVWELRRARWSAEDLGQFAELLAGSRIGPDSGAAVPLEAPELRRLWEELHERYLGESGPTP